LLWSDPRREMKRPDWLQKKVRFSDMNETAEMLERLQLHTVCQEASCPNISECFMAHVATFLILGRVCTRHCRFCNVEGGSPGKVDMDEPSRIAEAVKEMGIWHIVITSVTRDDLADGGAGAFVDTVEAVRSSSPEVSIEVLVPDFVGEMGAVEMVCDACPDVFGHNLETVPRLYGLRPGADYTRSLDVLRTAKKCSNRYGTKSGLMLGMGETREEVLDVLTDLRQAGCDLLSLGQYLAPSKKHTPVVEYVTPETFDWYKEQADGMGFKYVASAPYVRSSYLADQYL
jgi:lipoic acid synthetase